MRTLTITLDEKWQARLDALAEAKNCTVEELIHKSVNEYLERDVLMTPPPALCCPEGMEYETWVETRIQRGLEDVQAGRVISQEELDRRVRSLGIRVD